MNGRHILPLLLAALALVGCDGSADAYRAAVRTQSEQGPAAALPPLTRLAEAGHAQAQFRLAMLLLEGSEGVPRDGRAALDWLSRAADNGDVGARYYLGHFAHQGFGVPRDPARALELLSDLGEQGYAPAQFDVAHMYEQGLGTRADPAAAVQWYARAARGGFTQAAERLEKAYRTGELGLTADPAKADRWRRIANPGSF